MNWFHNLSYRWKISLPIGLLLALTLLVGINGLIIKNTLARNAEALGSSYLVALDALLQADRDMYQAQAAERGLIYLPDSSANYASLQQSLQENQQQSLERALKASQLSPAIARVAPADTINRLHRAWTQASARLLSLRAQLEPGDASLTQTSYDEVSEHFERLRDLIDKAGETHQAAVAEFVRQSQRDADAAGTRASVLLIVASLFGALTLLGLPPVFTKGLNQINATMANIASGEGDLTNRTQIHTADELGQLSTSFNRFMDTLQNTVATARSTADEVRAAADEMHRLGDANRATMSAQNSAIRALVTSVSELSSTVANIAQNTNLTAEQAQTANQLTRDGSSTVNTSKEEIAALAKGVESTSELIDQLHQQASEAGSVLDVISGIAEQTNLLALNAAIEAARAGEQGRGFAVVADEVRTLANKTQDSTLHIQQMLGGLQAGVEQAVKAMQSAARDALATVDTATQANSALASINNAVDQITQMSIQIATAAEEQSAVINELNENLAEIDKQSMNTTSNIGKAASASRNLNELAANLQQLLAGFKV